MTTRTTTTSMTLNDLERRNSPYFAFFSPNSIDFEADYITVVEDRPIVVVVIAKPAMAVASLHGDHVGRQSSRGLQEGCYCCPCGSGRSTCSGAGREDVSTRGWVVGRASDRCDVAVPCALGPLRQVWRYGRMVLEIDGRLVTVEIWWSFQTNWCHLS